MDTEPDHRNPLEPGAWTPEAVAFPDAFSTVAEMLARDRVALLLAPATRSRLEGSSPPGAGAVLLTTAVVVACSAVALGGAAMAHAHP